MKENLFYTVIDLFNCLWVGVDVSMFGRPPSLNNFYGQGKYFDENALYSTFVDLFSSRTVAMHKVIFAESN
jgi:hypothetical protein